MSERENTFIVAFDSKIKRRCVHVLTKRKKEIWAISVITGHSFKVSKKDLKKLEIIGECEEK
jgi:hypothetical protein